VDSVLFDSFPTGPTLCAPSETAANPSLAGFMETLNAQTVLPNVPNYVVALAAGGVLAAVAYLATR
jgi:hypothetical protein